MKEIKVSSVYSIDGDSLKSTIIFNLIRILSNKKIIYTDPENADILFIGPYDINTISNRINFFLKKKINLDFKKKIFLFKKKKRINIFISHENIRYDGIDADYFITSDMGVSSNNHLRIPAWKDYIDWSEEDFFQSISALNARRYGTYYKIENLMNPQGDDFIKKNKKFCIFSSHMMEPRKSIYLKFLNHFQIDGYGPHFDLSIKNHNLSSFKKREVLERYSFNLCPQNSLYPGYYGENVPDAFLAKTLPITWCDNNINKDFNEKSFINLLNYSDNYDEIINLIQDIEFLKKFGQEPLIKNKVNLDLEKKFVSKIIENLSQINS
jgi:hypothetical protein